MERGPLEVLDLAQFDLRVELPPWPVDAFDGVSELDALLAEVERDLVVMGAGAGDDWRGELERLHAEAEEGVYHDPLPLAVEELEGAAEAAVEADNLVVEAFAEIPGEAWQNLPAPYTPPAEEGGFIVTPEPGVTTPIIEPYIPPPAPVTPIAAAVSILNLTRGGAQNFWVGDRWRVTVYGPALSQVVVHGWHDGVVWTPVAVGLTDALGRWSMDGLMTEYERGYWMQQWTVAGIPCEPVLSFVVL